MKLEQYLRIYLKRGLCHSALMGVIFLGCGENDKVKYQNRSQATIETNNPLVVPGTTGESADATAAPVNSDEILRGLIEEEKNARVEADTLLNKRVDELANQLGALGEKLDQEIARLDAADQDILKKLMESEETLRKELTDQGSKFQQMYDSLTEDVKVKVDQLKAADAALDAAAKEMEAGLGAETAARIASITQMKEEAENALKEVSSAIDEASDEMKEELSLSAAALKKEVEDQNKKFQDIYDGLTADLKQKVDDLKAADLAQENAMTEMKADLDAETAARIAALVDLQTKSQKALEDATRALGDRITALDARVTAEVEDLRTGINETKKELSDDLLASLSASLDSKAMEEVKEVRLAMTGIQNRRAAARTALQQKVVEATQVLALTDPTSTEYPQKIEALDDAKIELQKFDASTEYQLQQLKHVALDIIDRAGGEAKEDLKNRFLNVQNAITELTISHEAAEVEMKNKFDLAMGAIADQGEKALSAMDTMKRALLAQVKTSETAVKDEVAKLRQEAFQAMSDAEKEDEAKVKALHSKFEALDFEMTNMAREHAAFKMQVANTYATKEELKTVKKAAAAMNHMTRQVLGKQLDDQSEEFKKAMNDQANKLRQEFNAGLSEVKADLDGIQNKLNKSIGMYKSQMREMNEHLIGAMKHMHRHVLGLRAEMMERDNMQQQMLEQEMRNSAMRFQAMTTTMKDQISNKLVELDQKVSATQKDLVAAKLQAKKELAKVVAEEQRNREKINSQIADMSKELDMVSAIAQRADRVAQTNASRIQLLNKKVDSHMDYVRKKFSLTDSQISSMRKQMKEMRNEYTSKINKVEDDARKLVRNLGEQTQKKFAKVSTEMADLQSKQGALRANMRQLAAKMGNGIKNQQLIDKELIPAQEAAVEEGVKMLDAMNDLYFSVMDAIEPNQDTAAKEPYNRHFKAIAQRCAGKWGTSFPQIDGRDSFQYLALEYISELVKGNTYVNRNPAFFGKAGPVNLQTFPGEATMSLLAYSIESGDEQCKKYVQNWAKYTLLNLHSSGTRALTSKMGKDAKLSRNVSIFISNLKSFYNATEKVEAVYKKFGSADKAPWGEIAADIREGVGAAIAMKDRDVYMNQIVETEKKMAKNAADIDVLDAKYKHLRLSLMYFKKQIEGRVAKTEQGLGEAFRLIASLAQRSDNQDILRAAVAAGKKYSGTTITPMPTFKPVIHMVQHFFQAPGTNNGNVYCRGGEVIRDYKIAHGKWNRCWVNYRNKKASTWLGAANSFKLRVYGSANKIYVKESLGTLRQFNDLKDNMRTSRAKVYGTTQRGVFDLQDPEILGPYIRKATENFKNTYGAWSYWGGATIYMTPYNTNHAEKDKSTGATVTYKLKLYSPLVLDFHNEGTLQTSPNNGMMFDLDGDGIQETAGWVSGRQGGFLVTDLNGNGKIDSGLELFGQATKIAASGKKAQNGYHALAQYDSNKDGFVDAQDSQYSKLKVWFDYNENGVSEASELKSLAETNVTKISVKYTDFAGKSIDKWNNGNELRYQAKFYGPETCGATGCTSYDVYFDTGFLVGAK